MLTYFSQPSLRDQVYVAFDLLGRQPPTISSAVAEQVAAGLILIATKHKDIIGSQTEWNVVFSLVKSTVGHPEASKQAFEFIHGLIEGPESRVSIDNFSGLVSVLDDYATAASIATEAQQQGRRTQALNSTKYVDGYSLVPRETHVTFGY